MAKIQHGKQPVSGKPSVRIVAEDREALEILAAYDRDEAPRQST